MWWAPPMITISGMASRMRGSFWIAIAMLVSGPTGHNTMSPSDSRYVWISQSTACSGRSVAPWETGGRSSRFPWIIAAIPSAACDRTIGLAMPRNTGISGMPIQSNTRKVFSVVYSTPVLPLTLVAPSSSMSGDNAATMRATASSVPVSTSRITFVGIVTVLRGASTFLSRKVPWSPFGPRAGGGTQCCSSREVGRAGGSSSRGPAGATAFDQCC